MTGCTAARILSISTGGNTVTSILTSESVKRLGLKEGMSVAALIKASDVLLAVA